MDNENKCNSVMVLAHWLKSGKWERICWVVSDIDPAMVIDGDDLAEDEDGVSVETPDMLIRVFENLFENGEEYYPDEQNPGWLCEEYLVGHVPNWREVDVGSTDTTDFSKDRVDRIRFVATIAEPKRRCDTMWRFLRPFPELEEMPDDYIKATAESILECEGIGIPPGKLNRRIVFEADEDGWCWMDVSDHRLPLGRIEQSADDLHAKIDLALEAMKLGAELEKGYNK